MEMRLVQSAEISPSHFLLRLVKRSFARPWLLGAMLLIPALAGVVRAAPLDLPGPTPEMRCPVCGMSVATCKNWLAAVRFQDGKTLFFDGVKDLLKYYHHIGAYEKERTVADIGAIFVTDYYTTELMDAATAAFVVGSNVFGPMGREFIPHKNLSCAVEFAGDHGGTVIESFQEITAEFIEGFD